MRKGPQTIDRYTQTADNKIRSFPCRGHLIGIQFTNSIRALSGKTAISLFHSSSVEISPKILLFPLKNNNTAST